MKEKNAAIKTTREVCKPPNVPIQFDTRNDLLPLINAANRKSTLTMMETGRGNPNWIATLPRDAFFIFGQFALQECRLNMEIDGILAGTAEQTEGIADRFLSYLDARKGIPGISLLNDIYEYGIGRHSLEPDALVREMTEAVLGYHYPSPIRMLPFMEKILHDFLLKEMYGTDVQEGHFDIFAVEGSTAAICYIFDSLTQNYLLLQGDRIALFTPSFIPYLDIPNLARYNFEPIYVEASPVGKEGFQNWHYPHDELDKLKDPTIKVALIVNPSNPTSVVLSQKTLAYIAGIVRDYNPELMIVTDDAYGNFVNNFQSLISILPYNTISVYSFSKYFGSTGWRLGTIAIHEQNVFDRKLAGQSIVRKRKLHERYARLSPDPLNMKFIDRIVADSRQVALSHTAGLSLPQQFQMMLFAAYALLDKQNNYKRLTQSLIQKRLILLWQGLEVAPPDDPLRAGYYSDIDVMVTARRLYGEKFASWLKDNFRPLDLVFRLAEKTSIVLHHGGGHAGNEWSIRVSLANLPLVSYFLLGKSIRKVLIEFVEVWEGHLI